MTLSEIKDLVKFIKEEKIEYFKYGDVEIKLSSVNLAEDIYKQILGETQIIDNTKKDDKEVDNSTNGETLGLGLGVDDDLLFHSSK